MDPVIAWDIAWDENIGSMEVHLIDKGQENTGTASKAPCIKVSEAPARDSLSYQSCGNEQTYIAFM